jgi:hypothetical protein
MTKQSGIRKGHFIRIEFEREHAAPQQVVVNVPARHPAKIGVRHFSIVRQVFHLIRTEAGGFEQLIGLSRHPTSPESHE